jgi:hypothetical protein
MFPSAAVRVLGDISEHSSVAESGATVTRTFCPKCGSSLFGRNAGMVGVVTISVGTLDEPDAVSPQVAIFARSRPRWDAMDGSLSTFESQPSWKPEDGV